MTAEVSPEVLRKVAFENATLTRSWDPERAKDIGYDFDGSMDHPLPTTQHNRSESAPDVGGVVLNEYHLADPEDDVAWQQERASRTEALEHRPRHNPRASSRAQNRAEWRHIADARRRRLGS